MGIDGLKLPKEAYVNKFIAKTKFYERAALSPKLQKEFIDKIQKITWKYKIAEETVGISKTKSVTEIQVFDIELKSQDIPKNVLKVIDKAIPYQILYRFIYQNEVAYAITPKQSNKAENYYFWDWNKPIRFDFSGIDLEKVYQKLVRAFIKSEAQEKEDFGELISTDNRIRKLEKEITVLENKMMKEKQFNRKVELNKVLLMKKNQLCTIKQEPLRSPE